MADDDLIEQAHAPQPYFPTGQTYCPASDVPSDQCHTCIVLAREPLIRADERRRALEDAADRANEMAANATARAAWPGTIGAQYALMSRAEDWCAVRDWLRDLAAQQREEQP